MTSRSMTRAAAVAGAAALTLAAGCGGGDAGTGGGGEEISLGMSLSTLNNPYFVSMRDGAQQAAKKAGVELAAQDAQDSPSTQADHLQAFITQGKSAIIVNPVDSDAVSAPVEAATEAGIPVVAADRGVADATVASTVASDNVEGGRIAARTLAKAIGKSGKVVVLQGTPGTSAARDRGQGFSQAIKEYPKIEVVARQPADFNREMGLNVMTNMLTAHPDIKGVFAQNDEMALGSIKALRNRAGSDVTVVGFDGTEGGLAAVRKGTMYATVAQQPEKLGARAVERAVAAVKDENAPARVKIPVEVVTQDNVDEFAGSEQP